jgi:phage gpG-like protein
MARSTPGQDDRDTSEACEPRHESQRRSSILDDENKLFFEQLDGLDGGYKEFLTWSTKDQEQAFDKMVEFLNEARDLCRRVDKILRDKDKAEYMAQEQQQENMVHTQTIIQKDGVIEYLQQQLRDSTPGSTGSVQKAKRKELKDPEKFTGDKDKETRKVLVQFEQWKADVEGKLNTDAHLFDTEDRRIRWVCGLTGGTAHNHVWPKLRDQEFDAAEDVLKFLTDIFDDPLKKQKAKQALAKLFQGSWTFHYYHSEFARITRILKLSDDDLKEELTSKLNEKYALTVLGDGHLSYAELVKKLYEVDKRIQATQALGTNRGDRSNDSQTKDATNDSSARNDTGRAGAAPFRPRFENQRSSEERALLYERKLCMRCCQPGHISPNCSAQKNVPFPANLKSILQKPKGVSAVEPESSDKEESITERPTSQGKE